MFNVLQYTKLPSAHQGQSNVLNQSETYSNTSFVATWCTCKSNDIYTPIKCSIPIPKTSINNLVWIKNLHSKTDIVAQKVTWASFNSFVKFPIFLLNQLIFYLSLQRYDLKDLQLLVDCNEAYMYCWKTCQTLLTTAVSIIKQRI